MEKNIRKLSKYILIKLRIVKWNGETYSNGDYVLCGLNKKNPMSWLLLVVISIPVGIEAAFISIKEFWEDSWA